MANVRTKAVVIDTSHIRLKRAALRQAVACQDTENAVARISADKDVAYGAPMQQTSFMHLLHLDTGAVKLSRLLDELGAQYTASTAGEAGDEALIVGKIYELACCLRKGGDSWLDFCRQPEWARKRPSPKLNRSDEALAHVCKLICDYKARAGQKAPADIVIALKPMWAAGSSLEEVVAAIKGAGSIAAMASLERRRKRAEKAEPESRISVILENPAVANRLDKLAVGEVLRLRVVKRRGGQRPIFEALRASRAKTREVSPPS